MSDYDNTTYGERWATFYDLLESPGLDTDGAVACLAEMAGAGPVLELGVGTGRVALPLIERGIDVDGIEASTSMIAKLREKPLGAEMTVLEGDLAEVEVTRSYSLIYAAYNTFAGLRDQDAQVRCLENVARALTPTGIFVVEETIPDMELLAKKQDVSVRFVDSNLLVLHAARYDSAEQNIVGQSIVISNGAVQTFPIQSRYTWPPELDLMARLAGLSRSERWADWHKKPFDASSKNHISVYRLKTLVAP